METLGTIVFWVLGIALGILLLAIEIFAITGLIMIITDFHSMEDKVHTVWSIWMLGAFVLSPFVVLITWLLEKYNFI